MRVADAREIRQRSSASAVDHLPVQRFGSLARLDAQGEKQGLPAALISLHCFGSAAELLIGLHQSPVEGFGEGIDVGNIIRLCPLGVLRACPLWLIV